MKDAALRWLWTVPGKKKLNILALIAVQALHGASGVFYALLLREVVDSATAQDRDGFWRSLALLIGLVLLQLTLRAVIRYLSEFSKSTLENVFKSRLTKTLLHRDLQEVNAIHTGEWLNRLTSDTRVVADGYVDILPGLAGMAVKLISAIVMIFALEPRFAAVLLPAGAVMTLLTWLFRRKLKTLHKRIREADGRLRVFLQERLGVLLMIRSFASEDRTGAEAEEKMREHHAARMRRNRFSNLANIGFGAAMSGMVLLGIGWCSYGILTGTVSFGTLTAVTQLIAQIQIPFANITGYLPRYYAVLASAERLMEAETLTDETCEAMPLGEITDFYRHDLCAFGLKDVLFTYYPVAENAASLSKDGMPAALEHLTLEIPKGMTVAFTGQSGCGKSTALRLLMCVYTPDGGERYCVTNDGERLTLSAAHRRLFAYVPQGNALMNGSIREVVSFADPEAAHDEERLTEALRIACADEFVRDLPDGPDTLLGERGAGLSEGQMQRLGIARAIFSGSPVLLLDEATSALDADTERRLLENLQALTDRTVVIVTHRTAALSICDRVLEFTESGVVRHDI